MNTIACVCRCCLMENPILSYNIFDNNSLLYNELLQCVPPHVNIAPNDGLPDVICGVCWVRVREAVKFRRRCEESDRELRKGYDEMNRVIDEVLDTIDREVGGFLMTKYTDNDPAVPTLETCVDSSSECGFNDLVLPATLAGATMPESNNLGNLDFLLEDLNLPTTTNLKDDLVDNDILEYLGEALTDQYQLPLQYDDVLSPPINEPEISSTQITSLPYTPPTSLIETAQHPDFDILQPAQPQVKEVSSSTFSPKQLKAKKLPGVHQCPKCEKTFTRNFQLKLHKYSVHNIGDCLPYSCPECKVVFASRHSLNYHYKSKHSAQRPYACSNCEKRFVLSTQLSSHMRIHTGEVKPRIHECIECGKRWPTKSDLRTHMRSHNPDQERPFKCALCEKSFFTRGHLDSHLLVHTGEKPYVCICCERSYQSVGNLNNHLARCHSDWMTQSGGTDASVKRLDVNDF